MERDNAPIPEALTVGPVGIFEFNFSVCADSFFSGSLSVLVSNHNDKSTSFISVLLIFITYINANNI